MEYKPYWYEWIGSNLRALKIGFDSWTLRYDQWEKAASIMEKNGTSLIPLTSNLVDAIWTDRPARVFNPIVPHLTKYAGREWQDKVSQLRQDLKEQVADALIVEQLDEIAWLLNLRGSDFEEAPVFYSYLILTQDDIQLFVNRSALLSNTESHLNLGNNGHLNRTLWKGDDSMSEQFNQSPSSIRVRVMPYTAIEASVSDLVRGNSSRIVLLSSECSCALGRLIPNDRALRKLGRPISHRKARKNSVEVLGMKASSERDSVALVQLFAWLHETIESQKNGTTSHHGVHSARLTATQAAAKAVQLRASQPLYRSPSFHSIIGSGPKSAVVHYVPTVEDDHLIAEDGMLLVDSGGQYLDGTTDVTRTIHFGVPDSKEKELFTRALQGHIGIATLKFPADTNGHRLDAIARRALWDAGLDYGHGTGHGVGSYLLVHEYASQITPVHFENDKGLQEGMCLSNEPGIYVEGEFGVRHESLVIAKKAATKYSLTNKTFLEFETITLVPFQLTLIDSNLLSEKEVAWINNYHRQCLEALSPHLRKLSDKKTLRWLELATMPINIAQESVNTKRNGNS